jgi:hypothetical protein
MDTILIQAEMVHTDDCLEVRCKECKVLLDRVPNERAAYTRAALYGAHRCELLDHIESPHLRENVA